MWEAVQQTPGLEDERQDMLRVAAKLEENGVELVPGTPFTSVNPVPDIFPMTQP